MGERDIQIKVDEEYSPEGKVFFLCIRFADQVRNIEGKMITEMKASPEDISKGFKTIASFLEKNPPENLNNWQLKNVIDFYKEAAENVPGLKK